MTTYAITGQRITLVIILALILWQVYAQIQEFRIRRRTTKALKTLLDASPEGWAITHREFLAQRRTQQELRTTREALIEAVSEDCREWEGNPFALDTPDEAA